MEEFDRIAAVEDRRAFIAKFGKVALVAPPVVTMLLSTSMSSPAIARSVGGPPQGNHPSHPPENNHLPHSPKGNNGVGNGYDPQPPGNPPVNDGPGAGRGNPGNKEHKLRP